MPLPPRSPAAWLLKVAGRRAIDAARRVRTRDGAQTALLLLEHELRAPGGESADIPDERLRLMFVCAHPAIEPAARAPLILQTVLGFDAGTIASAFLAAPVAMAQRLVRAKRKIRDAGVPFREPAAEEMPERLQSVLEAIYATFAEGWSDPLGSQRERGALAASARFCRSSRRRSACSPSCCTPRRDGRRGATLPASTCRSPIRIRVAGTPR